jgi:2-iminobutanoate/2-iminopropanoate deaminase
LVIGQYKENFMPQTRETVATEYAPAAIGPYAQAISVGDFVFCSGQIPLDPTTNTLVEGGVEVQTRRVLDNLAAVLQAGGSSLEQVVKTTIFLADMNDFATVNTIYAEYFGANPPARSTVQVARLPRDVAIEIEAIALRG